MVCYAAHEPALCSGGRWHPALSRRVSRPTPSLQRSYSRHGLRYHSQSPQLCPQDRLLLDQRRAALLKLLEPRQRQLLLPLRALLLRPLRTLEPRKLYLLPSLQLPSHHSRVVAAQLLPREPSVGPLAPHEPSAQLRRRVDALLLLPLAGAARSPLPNLPTGMVVRQEDRGKFSGARNDCRAHAR